MILVRFWRVWVIGRLKVVMMDSLPLIMGNIVDMKHFRSSFIWFIKLLDY